MPWHHPGGRMGAVMTPITLEAYKRREAILTRPMTDTHMTVTARHAGLAQRPLRNTIPEQTVRTKGKARS